MEEPIPQETCSGSIMEESTKNLESTENFQKFIYEFFDKNGILNDLRAYLRGHIVDVLRSAQTGDPPSCQKLFTQRLDLTFQALNILVAEYLLRLEFSYSLSVFISEIPLANMVFQFAKTLMESGSSDNKYIKFKDGDVWAILNYLGVKCESKSASNIVETYKSQEGCPLLLCILKEMPMYSRETICVEDDPSNTSISSDIKSSDSLGPKTSKVYCNKSSQQDKCKHYSVCKICQSKIIRLKEKHVAKRKNMEKNMNKTDPDPQNFECIMKNISVLEKSLIDEMFQQLKTVYEAEVEMVKEEQEKKVKRSIANHALLLQQKQNKLEESFRAREAELERNVQQKKKFLWGLARALRVQHDHMTRAMHDVRTETSRLTDKEESLKTQLAEAERVLRKRGEEMRTQISNELVVLEGHLQSMKNERDNINRERSELEHFKLLFNSKEGSFKINNADNDDLKPHYELIKDELSILRKYVESTKVEPKCVIERGTMTELCGVTSKLNVVLNNGQDAESMKSDDPRVKSTQVVNDLKKSKNVNFSQSNLDEIFRERSRSRSSASSEAGDSAPNREFANRRDMLLQLSQENERLKTFAAQQREHIDDLSSQQARLQAELVAERFRAASAPLDRGASPSRPRTAPAYMPQNNYFANRVNGSASANAMNYGWRKGAGEELSMFSNAQPRIYLPGDTIPFIGVLRDRHSDNRRHLINQWRILHRRTSPLGVIHRPRASSPGQREGRTRAASAGPSVKMDVTTQEQDEAAHIKRVEVMLPQSSNHEKPQQIQTTAITIGFNKNREKSPNSVLKEAKDKLRRDHTKAQTQAGARDKSPNSVLREAKLRLRKLEIEAEAVENSYNDFKKRQTLLRSERRSVNLDGDDAVVTRNLRDLDLKKNLPSHKLKESSNTDRDRITQFEDAHKSIKADFDKYLREYQTKFKLDDTYFRNRNLSTEQVSPIPTTYSEIEGKYKISNYIEKPLSEFRKFYESGRSQSPQKQTKPETLQKSPDSGKTSLKQISINVEDKKHEVETVNEDVEKTYNLPDEPIEAVDEVKLEINEPVDRMQENLLRVEVENVSAVNDIKVTDSQTQDLFLIVEGIGDREEIKSLSEEKIGTQMTIIVSPKRDAIPKGDTVETIEISTSVSPNKDSLLMTNDALDAIFQADDENNPSSVQLQMEVAKEALEDESEADLEYPDDFSADVDNYKAGSDYGANSPISLPKTSEDENFWDS